MQKQKGSVTYEGKNFLGWNGREWTKIDIGGSLDYSLDEQATERKWLDGRTIYQKTLVVTSGLVAGSNNLAHAITNLDEVITSPYGVLVFDTGTTKKMIPSIADVAIGDTIGVLGWDGTNIVLHIGSTHLNVTQATITFNYIKTA